MGKPQPPDGEPETPRASIDGESSLDLIRRAHDGDLDARDALFARYQRRLQIWAHGRLPPSARGPADTMDLVQDTLVQVFKSFDNFQPRHAGAFLGFVRTTLKNKVIDRIRQIHVRPAGHPIDDDHPTPDAGPDARYVATELMDRYEAALERLRAKDREAIILRIELTLPWTEVADALGLPSVAAAQMAVRRALTKLAREMQHDRMS